MTFIVRQKAAWTFGEISLSLFFKGKRKKSSYEFGIVYIKFLLIFFFKYRASAAKSSLQQKNELSSNDVLKRLDSHMGYHSTVMEAILRSVFVYCILLMSV